LYTFRGRTVSTLEYRADDSRSGGHCDSQNKQLPKLNLA